MSFKDIRIKLKEGYKNLKPIDHIKAKKNGHLWAVIGGSLALTVMLYNGIWYFSVFIAALIWLQFVELRKERQKIDGIVKMEQLMEFENKKIEL